MFSPTTSAIEELKTGMDKAYQKFKGTWVEPESSKEDNQAGAMFAAPEFIADDTLEGLAKQLGLEGDAVETFVAEIEKYNKFCEYGIDEDFGRYAEVLFPVKDGPFYALAGNPGLGEIMSTCGGIITNAEQNALDANFEPIPGLYVSGNDCGRRFGVGIHHPHARRKSAWPSCWAAKRARALPSTLRRSSCSQQSRHIARPVLQHAV